MSDNYGYDYTSTPTAGYDFGGFNYGYDYTSTPTAGSDFFAYFQTDQYGEGTPGVGFTSWTGGDAAAASSNPIMDILGNASKWFGSQDPKVQSTLIGLGGSFLAGAMGAKNKERLLKTQEKTANASMMNAQTAQKLADSKVAMQKNSQISNTNFGKPRTKGLIFQNKLAERQANPGSSGLIGAA